MKKRLYYFRSPYGHLFGMELTSKAAREVSKRQSVTLRLVSPETLARAQAKKREKEAKACKA